MRTRTAVLGLLASVLILTGCSQDTPDALGLADVPAATVEQSAPSSTSISRDSVAEPETVEAVEGQTAQAPREGDDTTDSPTPTADPTAIDLSEQQQPPPDEVSTMSRMTTSYVEGCELMRKRFPKSWWRFPPVLFRVPAGVSRQDVVEICKDVFNVITIGDCLVMPDGYCPGADLSGAKLAGAQMGGMELAGADLSGADLSKAHMTYADLSGANLEGARFDNAQLYGVNLRGASIIGTSFAGAELRDARWVDGRRCSLANIRGRCG